jgi:sterol desaturase/sphingolipid hydroxylase (fatty acid hydroxylase superfamily)
VSQIFWERLLAAIKAPFESFVSLQSSFHLLFLALTLLFCAGVYARHARRPLRLRTLRRFLLPRRVFLHASAKLDYKYYFIAAVLRAGMLGSMVVSSNVVAAGINALLTKTFGVSAPLGAPLYMILPLATIMQVVLFDLGYWIAHRTMHEIPLLWEFHKTHHAAEVLTPATSARSHPVDDLIQTNFIAGCLGLGYGVLVYLFGEAAQPITLFETNVIFFIYFLTIFHLRHSHIWLPIRGWLGYIIQSPAHHHIHHSTAPRHTGKNLGFCLSLWDWAFGTLYMPDKREQLEFGLGHESADFASIGELLMRPFHNAVRLLTSRAKPEPTPAVAKHET